MSDDLIKRLRDNGLHGSENYLHRIRRWAVDRNQAADAIESLTDRAEAVEKALAEVTAERDSWGALLADAYGADLDWEEMLMDRADQAALARIATIERETLERAAVAADDHTPEKHTGMTLASHCTGRSIAAAIRAMIEEKTDE